MEHKIRPNNSNILFLWREKEMTMYANKTNANVRNVIPCFNPKNIAKGYAMANMTHIPLGIASRVRINNFFNSIDHVPQCSDLFEIFR